MVIAWDEEAWQDYVFWQSEDKKTLKRINLLIKDMMRNGYESIGKDEVLKYMDGGWHSKRIDSANRLVYRIVGDRLEIIQCKTHYGDK